MFYDDKLLATIWRVLFVIIAFLAISNVIHELDPHGITWQLLGMYAVSAMLAKFSGLMDKE